MQFLYLQYQIIKMVWCHCFYKATGLTVGIMLITNLRLVNIV